jgi:hypothetical protein
VQDDREWNAGLGSLNLESDAVALGPIEWCAKVESGAREARWYDLNFHPQRVLPVRNCIAVKRHRECAASVVTVRPPVFDPLGIEIADQGGRWCLRDAGHRKQREKKQEGNSAHSIVPHAGGGCGIRFTVAEHNTNCLPLKALTLQRVMHS